MFLSCHVRVSQASLAKWLSVRLRIKWLWVRVPLQSLKSILMLTLSKIKRRKKLLILQWIIRIILNAKNKKMIIRSCQRFCRSTGWWELVWTQCDDKRFKKTFRISRNTFEYILSEIRVNIEK